MGRYYIILKGTSDGAPYVVGEVVREHDDDGRYRELSLAANLAGPEAMISTDEELQTTEVGKTLLRRWRAGNDHWFNLDTLRLGLHESVQHPAEHFAHMSSSQRDDLHAHIVARCEAVRRHGEQIRKENERLLDDLRAKLEELRQKRLECRTTLGFAAPRHHPVGRRHLRSVS